MPARRTSLIFPQAAVAQLNALMALTYIDSHAEMVRIAVRAYGELLALDGKGARMWVIDRAGESWPFSPYTPMNYPGLDREGFNARAAAGEDKVKAVTLFFSGDVIDGMEAIKVLTHIRTHGDTVRTALANFKELILVQHAGARVCIELADGQAGDYNPFRPFRVIDQAAE